MMKVNHIAILSFNFEKCVAHYSELLNTIPKVKDVKSEQVKVAIYHLENIQIEIFTPQKGNNKFNNRKEGLHHIAFDDLESSIEPFIKTIDKDGKKCEFFHPKDMHGVLIESIKSS